MTKTISSTIIIMCLFGLAISIYLYRLDRKVEAQMAIPQTFKTLETAPCDINAIISCSTVAKSEYSEIADIKVALLGIVGYVAILILYAVWILSRNTKVLYLFAASAFCGTLFSTYLTYLEFAVIEAVCPWCMVSYVLMLAITGLGMYLAFRLRKQDQSRILS